MITVCRYVMYLKSKKLVINIYMFTYIETINIRIYHFMFFNNLYETTDTATIQYQYLFGTYNYSENKRGRILFVSSPISLVYYFQSLRNKNAYSALVLV